MPVALVYWGRLGAGASLMDQIAGAISCDERFDLFLSPSLQSELPPRFPAERLLAIDTFTRLRSLVYRTVTLPATIRRLIRDLRARNVQAIVTIMPHVWGLPLQRAAARAGIRTLLIVHDADPHPGERRSLFDWLVRREIRGSDGIVTFSDYVADRLVARGDAGEDRISRLFHPIFRFGKPRLSGRGRPFRLLFFGRIQPYKGVAMLLDAFAQLRAAGIDATLRIVGRGEIDAPDALKTQPGVTIDTGWVAPDAIGDILTGADAIVLPYLEASQSGVVAAAYGAGLPVVATPVGGLGDQVIDGTTGTLAVRATAGAFASAMQRLIQTQALYETCRIGVDAHAKTQSPENFARVLGDAILTTVSMPRRT